MPALNLFIDVQNRCLVRAFNNGIGASLPSFFQGDTLQLSLEFLNATGNPAGSAPYTDLDFSAYTVQLGLGTIGAAPAAGAIGLIDPDTSAVSTLTLPFNATAAQAQAALQTLPAWSAATVTGNVGGPFVATNGVNGLKGLLQGNNSTLAPTSNIVGFVVQAGSGTLPAIQQLSLVQLPIAYQNAWTPAPAAAVTITQVQAGGAGLNATQQILLNNNPYAGSFPLTLGGQTASILLTDSLTTVQSKLQALSSIGAGNCTVGGSPGSNYIVTFVGALANTAEALFTSSPAGLVIHPMLTATLALNTAGVEQLIGENASATCALEIKVTPPGGSSQVLLQLSGVTILNDMLQATATVPLTGDHYLSFLNWLNANPAALTPSAAGASSVSRGAPTTTQYVAPSAGSGAYTYALTLGTAGAVRGDILRVVVAMPASANPTITVIGSTTESVLPTNAAYKSHMEWTYNGTAWDINFRTA